MSAGHTAWRTWLKCVNPAQTLPASFQPHVQLQPLHTAQHAAQQPQHTGGELLLPRPHKLLQLAKKTSCQVAALDSDDSSGYLHSQQPQSTKQHTQQNNFVICIGGWLFSCACATLLQVLQNRDTAAPHHRVTAHLAGTSVFPGD